MTCEWRRTTHGESFQLFPARLSQGEIVRTAPASVPAISTGKDVFSGFQEIEERNVYRHSSPSLGWCTIPERDQYYTTYTSRRTRSRATPYAVAAVCVSGWRQLVHGSVRSKGRCLPAKSTGSERRYERQQSQNKGRRRIRKYGGGCVTRLLYMEFLLIKRNCNNHCRLILRLQPTHVFSHSGWDFVEYKLAVWLGSRCSTTTSGDAASEERPKWEPYNGPL